VVGWVRVSNRFNGVKVFSATMFQDRERLGDRVTDWIGRHPEITITDLVVTQSSDASFHCVAITLFFWTAPTSRATEIRASR
jgi:hypothetical protein